jgi:hypothetical protein
MRTFLAAPQEFDHWGAQGARHPTVGLLDSDYPDQPRLARRGVVSFSVTAFFVPDSAPGTEAERAYARILEAAAADVGHRPRPVRIFKLSFRHQGADLDAEVGRPDPVGGRTVMAILDLGRESPYLIHCAPVGGSAHQMLVGKPVYSVTEFSA